MADDELDWKKDRIRQQAKKAREQASAVVGADDPVGAATGPSFESWANPDSMRRLAKAAIVEPSPPSLASRLYDVAGSTLSTLGNVAAEAGKQVQLNPETAYDQAKLAQEGKSPDNLEDSPGSITASDAARRSMQLLAPPINAMKLPLSTPGATVGSLANSAFEAAAPEVYAQLTGSRARHTSPMSLKDVATGAVKDVGNLVMGYTKSPLDGGLTEQIGRLGQESGHPELSTAADFAALPGHLAPGVPNPLHVPGRLASEAMESLNVERALAGKTPLPNPTMLEMLGSKAPSSDARRGGILIKNPSLDLATKELYINKAASNVVKKAAKLRDADQLDDTSPLLDAEKADVVDALRARGNNPELHDAIADLYGVTPKELRNDVKALGQDDVPGQAPNLGSSTASTADADIAKQLKQVKTTPEGEVKEAYLTPKQISEYNRKQAAELGLSTEMADTDREALSQARVARMQAYYAKQGGLPKDVIDPVEYAVNTKDLGGDPGELAQYDLGTQPGAALKKQLAGLAKDLPPLKPAASKPVIKTPNPEPAAGQVAADIPPELQGTQDAAPPPASEPPTVATPAAGPQYGMSRYTGQRTAGFNSGTIEPETAGIPTNTYDMVAGPGGELVPAPPPSLGYKKYLAGPQATEADPFARQGSNFFDEVSAAENPQMNTYTDIKPFPRMYDDAADPFAPQSAGSFSGAATGATPYTTSELQGGLRSAKGVRRRDTGTAPSNTFSTDTDLANRPSQNLELTPEQGPGPWGPPQGPENQPPRPANVARPISSDGLPKKTSMGNWKWTSWITNTNNMMEQVQSWANWAKKVLADPGAALKARASGFTASIQDAAKANESIDRIGRALDESGKSYSKIGPAMQAAQDYALAALFGRSKAALGLKQPLTNPNFPWAKFSRASVLADDTIASKLFSGPNGPQVVAEGAQAPLLEAYKLALNHTSTEAAAKHVPTMGANGLEEWGGVQDSSKFLRRMNQHSLQLMNSNPDVMNEVTSKLGMLPGNEGIPQQAGIAEFQRGYLQPADRQAPLEHLRVYKVVPDSMVLDNGTELPLNDFVHHFVPTRGYGDGTGLPGLFRNMLDRIHLIGEMGSQGMDDPRFLNLLDGADGYLASLGKISPAAKEAFEAMYAGYHHQRTAAGYFGLNMSNNLLLSPMASFARGAGSLMYGLAVAAAPLKDMLRPIYQAGMDGPGGPLEKLYSGSKAAVLQGWNLAGSMLPGVGKYMTGGGYKQVMSRYGVVPANYAGSALAAIARMQGEVNTLTKTENAFRYLGDNPITWATSKFADAVFGSAEITTAQMERQHAMSYMREAMKPQGISDASLVQLKNNGMNPDMLQWLRQQAGKADIPADEAQEFVNSMVRNGVNRFNKMSANPVFNQRIVNTPAFNIVKPFKNYIYTMARDVEDNGKVIRAIFDTNGPMDGKLKAVASRLGGMAVKYGVVTAGAGLATKAIYNYFTGREGTDWERQAPNKAAALLVGLGSAGVFGPTGEAGDALLSQFDQKFGTKLRPWGMEQGREVPPPAPLGLDFPLQAGRKIADLGMAAAGRGLYNAGLTPKNPDLARAAAQAVGPAARVASTVTQGAAATQQLFGKSNGKVRLADALGQGAGPVAAPSGGRVRLRDALGMPAPAATGGKVKLRDALR